MNKTKVNWYYSIEVEDRFCPGGWDELDIVGSKRDALREVKRIKKWIGDRNRVHRISKMSCQIIFKG